MHTRALERKGFVAGTRARPGVISTMKAINDIQFLDDPAGMARERAAIEGSLSRYGR